jgi:hypothetical protein
MGCMGGEDLSNTSPTFQSRYAEVLTVTRSTRRLRPRRRKAARRDAETVLVSLPSDFQADRG